ncbi:hypothetical protein GCM10022215_24090 [Nocardioides fonticola]|uniref:Uncharacterized protein n=1 Tax=Nocardioides fonticola TaxID=450363 RepID=A0ABP7XK67_9ACTN
MTDEPADQVDEPQSGFDMRLIPGPLRRPVGPDSFTGLTDAAVTEIDAAGVWFARDLTDDERTAIAAFVTSSDDSDLTARDLLARALDGTGTGPAINLAELAAAYLLGRPLPDPVFSPPAPPTPQE